MASMGTRGGDGDQVAGTGIGTWLSGWGGDRDMVVGTGWGWGKNCRDGVGTGTKYFTVSFSSVCVLVSQLTGNGCRLTCLSPRYYMGVYVGTT